MSLTRSFRLHMPACFPVLFIVLLFVVVSGNPCWANPVEPVSFSWQANPPEDYVLGYKLYYGSESRFDASGRPITNFSYDYYIDFASFERCVLGTSSTVCDILGPNEVECENLSGDFPSCTLHNLQGELYFSLTAYNTYAESDYTVELSMNLGNSTKTNFPILRFINSILLQQRSNT